MLFETVVLEKTRLGDADTLFTALFVPCSVTAALFILLLLAEIMALSLKYMYFYY